MSRIGKKLVVIPKDVKIQVEDGVVCVEGPKGKLTRKLSDRISIEIKDGQLLVKRAADTKIDKSLHGLFRALIVNMIVGVTQGYLKELEIQGVGFKVCTRAERFLARPGNDGHPRGVIGIKRLPDFNQRIIGREIQRIHFVCAIDGDQSHVTVGFIEDVRHFFLLGTWAWCHGLKGQTFLSTRNVGVVS